MKPLTLRFVLDTLGLELPPGADPALTFPDLCVDSRACSDGCLFVPILGERFDGHEFIPAAFLAGAAAALSDRDLPPQLPADKIVLRVSDTLQALQTLTRAYRQLFCIPIVGITGSVGKTTTKELVYSVLSQRYNTLKNQGNLNNQTGVPATLLRLEAAHQAAVVEMGTNHFGEIDRLAAMVQPDVCLVTNIGESHIEFLGSKEGILQAKSEMFAHMRPGGTIIVNGDDPLLATLRGKYPNVTTYGLGVRNDVHAKDIRELGLLGSAFTLHYSGGTLAVHVPAPGTHMVLNALAAFCTGLALGVDPGSIAQGIEAFTSSTGRMNIAQTNTLTLLDDAYNASPTSMRASIDVAVSLPGRSVLVLGDILELGKDAQAYHSALGEYCAQKKAALVLTVGALSAHLQSAAKAGGVNALHFESTAALTEALPGLLQPGDTVLVKASHGMHFEEVCTYITSHF